MGQRGSSEGLYDHALATRALAEAAFLSAGAVVRHRSPASSPGAGEAEAQAQAPCSFSQLLLHGRQVPGVLHHV